MSESAQMFEQLEVTFKDKLWIFVVEDGRIKAQHWQICAAPLQTSINNKIFIERVSYQLQSALKAHSNENAVTAHFKMLFIFLMEDIWMKKIKKKIAFLNMSSNRE